MAALGEEPGQLEPDAARCTRDKAVVARSLVLGLSALGFPNYPPMSPQRLHDSVSRQRKDPKTVGAGHRLRRYHRVGNRFLGGIDRRFKQR